MPHPLLGAAASAAGAAIKTRLAARILAIALPVFGLLFALPALAFLGLHGGLTRAEAGSTAEVACALSADGRDGIPAELLPIYDRAANAYGLGGRGAIILAAINKIETNFGKNQGPSSAGAVGWMQFMPATWSAYGVDADDDGTRDPADPDDAIHAAANYLRASGAPGDWYKAIFAYNHADWYVRDVLDLADRYQSACELNPAAQPAEPGGDGTLRWPTTVRTITGRFGENRGTHRHAGIDIAAPHGAPIMAAAAGEVVLVQGTATSGGYGNYVCVQHGTKLRTCYAHLSAVHVRVGDGLAAGQVLGACGNTGRSFGPHLHFEVRSAPAWSPVDPLPRLPNAR